MLRTMIARAVIDTNVVLDWLVFGNADAQALAHHITGGKLRWLSTAAMRDELEHVLTRDTLVKWQPRREHVLRAWDQWSQPVTAQSPVAVHGLHCSDADDQKFVDLAVGTQSTWLFTRDRSLLQLTRRARGLGVEIVTPSAWLATIAAGAIG
jgi:uncharacterized protein